MANITVLAGGDLQAAINGASLGDTIFVEAGATFTGNFTLPVKSGSSTLTITTTGTLPPGRVSPSDAAQMPTIQTTTVDAVIATDPSAHNYSLVGLHLQTLNAAGHDLITLGDGSNAQNNLTLVPHHLVIDRCYIHGTSAGELKRGIALNSASTDITNSYISDCKGIGYDTQAILGWNGPGPYLIDNNYLEGAGENVMFGGADTSITNLIPSNITITNNHFFKPIAWRSQAWTVKNLFELKNATHVVVQDNVFENCWSGAQVGIAVQLTVRNQDGTNNWATIAHVNFSNNVIKHAGGGFSILGTDDQVGVTSVTMTDVLIAHNLLFDIDGDVWGGSSRFIQISHAADHVTVNHNTAITNPNALSIFAYDAPETNFVATNNILTGPIFGDGLTYGNVSIAAYFPGSTWLNNAWVGQPSNINPVNNFYPATLADVEFVDLAHNDYRLSVTSPYHNAGTDGTDVGYALSSGGNAVGTPTSPSPVDGAVGVSLSPMLTWSASDATTYDVYFGTTSSPPLVSSGQADASYLPVTLTYSTVYYWKIVAHGVGDATGPVWSFTTLSVPGPPTPPKIVHDFQWALDTLILKVREEEKA